MDFNPRRARPLGAGGPPAPPAAPEFNPRRARRLVPAEAPVDAGGVTGFMGDVGRRIADTASLVGKAAVDVPVMVGVQAPAGVAGMIYGASDALVNSARMVLPEWATPMSLGELTPNMRASAEAAAQRGTDAQQIAERAIVDPVVQGELRQEFVPTRPDGSIDWANARLPNASQVVSTGVTSLGLAIPMAAGGAAATSALTAAGVPLRSAQFAGYGGANAAINAPLQFNDTRAAEELASLQDAAASKVPVQVTSEIDGARTRQAITRTFPRALTKAERDAAKTRARGVAGADAALTAGVSFVTGGAPVALANLPAARTLPGAMLRAGVADLPFEMTEEVQQAVSGSLLAGRDADWGAASEAAALAGATSLAQGAAIGGIEYQADRAGVQQDQVNRWVSEFEAEAAQGRAELANRRLLTGPPPAPDWVVSADGKITPPGFTPPAPRQLPAPAPAPQQAGVAPPLMLGYEPRADWVGTPDGMLAPPNVALAGADGTVRAPMPPRREIAPSADPNRMPGAQETVRPGARIATMDTSAFTPANARPVADAQATPASAPPAAPINALPPDEDLDNPERLDWAKTDPEASPERFGLPPAPKRDSLGRWQLDRKKPLREQFRPDYHDALDFLALHGGLNRDVWSKKEGVDPATWRKKDGARDDNWRFGAFGPQLFPKDGGLTPSQARELLQSNGFLPPVTDGAERIDDRAAVEIVTEGLMGRRRFSDRAQETRAKVDAIRREQEDFMSLRRARDAADAEARELGMTREGLAQVLSRARALEEIDIVADEASWNDALALADIIRRAEQVGFPPEWVEAMLDSEQSQAEKARRLLDSINREEKRRGRPEQARPEEARAPDLRRDEAAPRGEGRAEAQQPVAAAERPAEAPAPALTPPAAPAAPPAAPAPVRAGVDLFAPPTAAEAIRAETARRDEARNSMPAGVSLTSRGDLFGGGGAPPAQTSIVPGDGVNLAPNEDRRSPAGAGVTSSTPTLPDQPATTPAQPAPKKALRDVMLEVETTEGDVTAAPADRVLRAAEKRVAMLRRLLECVRT